MLHRLAHRVAVRRVPQARRAVLTPGQDTPTVRALKDTIHCSSMHEGGFEMRTRRLSRECGIVAVRHLTGIL